MADPELAPPELPVVEPVPVELAADDPVLVEAVLVDTAPLDDVLLDDVPFDDPPELPTLDPVALVAELPEVFEVVSEDFPSEHAFIRTAKRLSVAHFNRVQPLPDPG
jgi:hypothetical protein